MSSNNHELGYSNQPSKFLRSIPMRSIYVLVALLGLLLVTTFILAAVSVSLGVQNQNKIDDLIKSNSNSQTTTTTATTTSAYQNTTSPAVLDSLEGAIQLEEVFDHLRQFQRIADSTSGSRAIGTLGFNLTVDYIRNYLGQYSELVIKQDLFTINSRWSLYKIPLLTIDINDAVTHHTYINDFVQVHFSKPGDFSKPVRLTVVENTTCNDSDWKNAAPHPANEESIVLIKWNDCIYEHFGFANRYNVGGLLVYNDGTSSHQGPLLMEAPENTAFPALFLSYKLGNMLAQTALDPNTNISVAMTIPAYYIPSTVVENICAWTKTGDPTQTIVIGSHSDSVPTGAGINDNGSGSAVNLALAATLARLYQSGYEKYPYRIKFCWWAAEELGLLGSIHHTTMSKTATAIGERIQDYLVYLNYDMLGSSNYMFGIYDGQAADRDTTPPSAIPGSIQITEIYRSWFDKHSLPWTNESLSTVRSDQASFLEAGVVVGGLFSGAEQIKSTAERNAYELKLGHGRGGIAEVAYDSCYHQPCDTIQNINTFAMEQMTKAAAFTIEYLGRLPNLKRFLYPTSKIQELEQTMKNEGRQLQKVDLTKAFYKSYGIKVVEE